MKPEIIFHDEGDTFVVETRAPAGYALGQHAHETAHLSYLVSGDAMVDVDGVFTAYRGPCMLTIEAHKQHSVHAITPIVWLCIWNSDESVKSAARDSLKLLEVL